MGTTQAGELKLAYSTLASTIIVVGERYIIARKLIKGATELQYVASDRQFYLNCEDVRVGSMKHSEVVVRRSSRATTMPTDKKIYEFDQQDVQKLKLACWDPLTQRVNL